MVPGLVFQKIYIYFLNPSYQFSSAVWVKRNVYKEMVRHFLCSVCKKYEIILKGKENLVVGFEMYHS